MITIQVGFPAGGRWHATAWGTHVNEGIPEWPPSPWRICRALLATWYWKHRESKDILDSLISKIASTLPSYRIPEASSAHTRHYMPVNEGKKEKRTKVFDTFVQIVGGASLYILWDVELSQGENQLLSSLLEKMNYMGRAESLISARLISQDDDLKGEWVKPINSATLYEKQTGEIIRLLSPEESSIYEQWTKKQQDMLVSSKGKKKKYLLPESVLHALEQDTADWKKEGWDVPPGSRWVQYIRPSQCFKIAPISRPNRKLRSSLPTVSRFAITTKVPPSITQSLSVAERIHQAICYQLNGIISPALTGLDDQGKPLTNNDHVYYLPECDVHGYITHMTLHAPRGFSDEDARILSNIRKVWNNAGKGFDLKIVQLATGNTDDFNPASPYFRKSKVWESLTPFIPVRHAKTTNSGIPKLDPENSLQIGSPEHDCLRLLQLIMPQTKVVSITRTGNGSRIQYGNRDIPCLQFQRIRRTGNGTHAGNRGYALRIEFEQETSLPYGVGYGAHFGLGLFAPVFP